MRIACPACGATLSLDAVISHDGAREAVMIALQLPAPLGKLLVQYISLFRPLQRQLSMDRLATLLGELLPMLQEGKVERNKTTYSAPQEYWKQALEEMLAKRDTLTLPLKSHGYLITIIAGFADKALGKKEIATEQKRKYGPEESAPKQARSVMPASVRKTLRNLTGKPQEESTDGNS